MVQGVRGNCGRTPGQVGSWGRGAPFGGMFGCDLILYQSEGLLLNS